MFIFYGYKFLKMGMQRKCVSFYSYGFFYGYKFLNIGISKILK